MARCYTIKCIVCGVLEQVSRSDAHTCSGRCRVRLSRHPELSPKHPSHPAAAVLTDIPLSFHVQALAYVELFPERRDAIVAGKLSLEHPTRRDVISNEARDEANREFVRRVFELAELLSLSATS
jgi:hypothetical protein